MTEDILSSVIFRKLQSDEFDRFVEWSIKNYAEELLLSKQSESQEKALIEAKKEFNEILPQGLDTKDNYLMSMVNEQQENVGIIWYNIDGETIFICDFVVFENYRRQNFGFKALAQLEKIAAAANKEAVRLHVFSYNTPALNLYKKFGFIIEQENGNGSIFMKKKCT